MKIASYVSFVTSLQAATDILATVFVYNVFFSCHLRTFHSRQIHEHLTVRSIVVNVLDKENKFKYAAVRVFLFFLICKIKGSVKKIIPIHFSILHPFSCAQAFVPRVRMHLSDAVSMSGEALYFLTLLSHNGQPK
jgi:hypothetical protein